jgi:hypothetical protein
MGEWQDSWHAFVSAVAAEANTGKRGRELSCSFEGAAVTWLGRVAEMKLNAKYARGVRMSMPLVIVPLHERGLVAEHLWLSVGDPERSSWEGVAIGDDVQFSARIKRNAVFSALDIAPDDEQGRDYLEIGVECCRYLRHA